MDSTPRTIRTCQWCTNPIADDATVCQTCGAATPNPELSVRGLKSPGVPTAPGESDDAGPTDDLAEARAIVERLERLEGPAPVHRPQRDASDDLPMIMGVLVGAAIIGGLVGWLLLPPLLVELFESQLGIESDGPGDFRRMGAFIGALVSLLFGALLGTLLRR